jgi:transcriptional regulator with XRE-family HTH domain
MTVETSQGVIPQWTVPDKIRKAREHAGLSQQELADRLSVTRTSVINWERGHTRPLRLILRLLAQETGVDEQWLGQEGPLISLHTDIPAGIPAQPVTTAGHAVVDNDITRRMRKRIPLNPALALVLRMAS